MGIRPVSTSDSTGAGPRGPAGADGLSAYQQWLAAGNTGTAADFLASLEGHDGASAYALWLSAGNIGSVADFLASLKGTDGKDGKDAAAGTGSGSSTGGFTTRQLFIGAGVSPITVPDGVTRMLVKAYSAGAGGQNKTNASLFTGATQSGAYGESIIAVAPGDILSINVGVGGPAVDQNGAPPNPAAVDTLIYRNGTLRMRVPGGFSPNTKTGCDVFIPQSTGMANVVVAGTEIGFVGASAPRGGAGGSAALAGTGDGDDGKAPGGAGSNGGGALNARGGKGADGLVELWY
jgi:hypothetical protein